MSVFMLFGIFAPCVGASDLHEHLKEDFYTDESTPLTESISRLYTFVSDHCDEIYTYAYMQAKNAGLIDELNVYLDEAVQAIRYAENLAFGYEAYFRSEEFAVGLRVAADETADTVEALRDLLVHTDSLDAEARVKAMVLLEKLESDLNDFESLNRIAVEDALVYADDVLQREIDKLREVLNEKSDEIREAAAFTEFVLKEHGVTTEAFEDDFIRFAEKYRKNFADNREYTEEELHLLLQQFIGNAFFSDYRISSDSFYLAIGEDTLYADILAKRLGLRAEQFGMTGWNAPDSSLIAKADLITVGYSESIISGFAANQILCYIKNYADVEIRNAINAYTENLLRHLFGGMTFAPGEDFFEEFHEQTDAALDSFLESEAFSNIKSESMDWAALVGKENAEYADSVRQIIRESLIKTGIPETYTLEINLIRFLLENPDISGLAGLDILALFQYDAIQNALGSHMIFTHELPVLDMLMFAVESYLYGYVKFNIEYARLVYAIGVLNPNAKVVLLGNYHAFADIGMDVVIDDITIGFDMLPDCGIKDSFDDTMHILADIFDVNAYQSTVNAVFDEMETRIAAVYDKIKTVQGYVKVLDLEQAIREIDISEAELVALVGEKNAESAKKILCVVHYLFEEFDAYDRIEEEIPDVKKMIAELAALANQKTDAVLEETFGVLGITVSEARGIFSALTDRMNAIHAQIEGVQSCVDDIYETITSLDITIKGASFDLGEVLSMPMLAHSVFYAFAYENVIFVDISDAQIVYDNASGMDFLLEYLFDQTICNVNEAGHVYIAEQICRALRIICGHSDGDSDHFCDYCGEALGTCSDMNRDHLCDVCGKMLRECEDMDNDHLCDVCGAVCSMCVDGDKNHLCDVCEKIFSECTDEDNNHLCDVCGEVISMCADEDNDHLCDVCNAVVSRCADTDRDHKCNVCGTILSKCADTNNDHKCNVCGTILSACADTDNDHKCNVCGTILSECADTDRDHKCNVCGKLVSACADTDNDHKCNVCGTILSECADTDRDHKCNVCGTILSACADMNDDHKCDVCDSILSECEDGDHDHICDICGKRCSECIDSDNDHRCDVCRSILSECSYGDWIVVKEATRKEEGDCYRECLICGKRNHGVIPRIVMSTATIIAVVTGIAVTLSISAVAVYCHVYKKKNAPVEMNDDDFIFS